MDQRESDPTGAFSGGGAARLDDERTELERHDPSATAGDDADAEREAVVGGTAATSEIADPDAQDAAEAQGDGTPLPR
jgi:hypothetical protein